MIFEDKFIAFVDVLGFKTLVRRAEDGTGLPLKQLLHLLERLENNWKEDTFRTYGPTVCPHSRYNRRDLQFQVTQISDCVIVSSEVSPAGAINLISHCWGAVLSLLTAGIMCRGYITRGSIYHQKNQVIGSGYQEAYESEGGVSAFKREADERGTPFVEIDRRVIDFVDSTDDKCVKEMFSRMVKRTGDTAAIYPFKRLNHSFVFAGMGVKFDPDREKRANDDVRQALLAMRKAVLSFVDTSNEDAVRKAEHYVDALDEALKNCSATDKTIDELQERFPRDT